MKHVLFVDDDAVTLKLYESALTRLGFQVTAVADGIRASQALISTRPDVVVLDLMMPNFNGVDVLKFIRSNNVLNSLPVIVLTNSYLTELAEKAVAMGVQDAILKVRCSPSALAAKLNAMLDQGDTLEMSGSDTGITPTQPAASPTPAAPDTVLSPTAPTEPTPAPGPGPVLKRAEPQRTDGSSEDAHAAQVRSSLLANATKIRGELHALHQEFVRAQTDTERNVRLQNLYRRIHFLSTSAGMAACHRVALLSCAFEALLFEMMNQPALITPSTKVTVATANDFLGQLLGKAKEIEEAPTEPPRVLIVDDDPLANRLISSALRYDHLNVRTTEDPFTALQWASEAHFDLFLLDIEMPGLDGFQLCEAIRTMPEYQRAPIIFVTSHDDFDNRAQSVLTGGNDLISKPVMPIELAVKAVTHLLRADLDNPSA